MTYTYVNSLTYRPSYIFKMYVYNATGWSGLVSDM